MFNIIMEAGATTAKGNPIMSILPIVAMFGILYFLMIRPQQKKQKETQKMLENLKIHDEVVTAAGIVGKIANFKKERNTVVVKVDDNVKMEFQRQAIVGVLNEIKEEKK